MTLTVLITIGSVRGADGVVEAAFIGVHVCHVGDVHVR